MCKIISCNLLNFYHMADIGLMLYMNPTESCYYYLHLTGLRDLYSVTWKEPQKSKQDNIFRAVWPIYAL